MKSQAFALSFPSGASRCQSSEGNRKEKFNRFLRIKSEGLEIKSAGHRFSLTTSSPYKYPANSKEYIYQSGSNHAKNLSAEEINRSIKETLSSLLADASSILQACLIRVQYMDIFSVTYFGNVNKSVELREN